MARNTPRVDGTLLIERDGAAPGIAVGGPSWYAWLEQATTFAFTSPAGSFTARKERSGSTGWYWKAYRKRAGRLHRAYLGKSADLTLDRLTTIAGDLAQRSLGQPTVESSIAVASTRFTDGEPLHAIASPAPSLSPAEAPLLSTKLYIPSPRPQFVPRPRLAERVRAGLRSKLTLISAPAGFGKSTLLAACIAERQKAKGKRQNEDALLPCTAERQTVKGKRQNEEASLPFAFSLLPLSVAWVSLDAEDNDPARFWSYVIAALETAYPAMDATARAMLRSPQLPAMEALMAGLINAINPMDVDVALVLDDYHLIATSAIHTALTYLLDHLPPQLHLVILTRADPPLPLTRLRMRGELTELRAADLRFTADEAAAFLAAMTGLSLTSDEVAALEARTEGWIAGLQLAALAMQGHADTAGFVAAFSGSNRFVVDYLLEEVLAQSPAHLQHFVLQTAILDRLCGPLCDAVIGIGDQGSGVGGEIPIPDPRPLIPDSYSQLILNELDRQNMFLVPLDDQRRWYRYHHLFGEVLRARLRSGATARELAALYQRASAWHEREGLIGEAVRYAFLIEDVERAATLIERYGMAVILDSSDVLLVRTWVEQLPRALILARPRLALIAACTLALVRQFAAAEQLLADAAAAFGAPGLASDIIGELSALRSLLARSHGYVDGTYALAQQAVAHLDAENSAFRAVAALNIGVASMWRGDLVAARGAYAEALALGQIKGQWIALAALEELASLQSRLGLLHEMRQTAEQAIQLSTGRGGRPIPAAGMGYVGVAEVLYEWGDLAGAMHAATQGVELLWGAVERMMLMLGYVVLAKVYQAQGDHVGALDCFRRAEEWFAHTRVYGPDNLALLAASRAQLWVRQGNLSAAAQWAQECVFEGDTQVGCVQQLALVRLRLAQAWNDPGGQSLAEAGAILARLLPMVEARGWVRYQIEILSLQALVSQAQPDRAGACAALERVLALAEPASYLRSFVDEGAPMAALLAQIAHSDSPVASYAIRLLRAFPKIELHMPSSEIDTGSTQNSKLSTQNFLAEPLTVRELEILRLIAAGHSNQAIADLLVVVVGTVKKHINNIYGKLGVRSRTQALALARELGLL